MTVPALPTGLAIPPEWGGARLVMAEGWESGVIGPIFTFGMTNQRGSLPVGQSYQPEEVDIVLFTANNVSVANSDLTIMAKPQTLTVVNKTNTGNKTYNYTSGIISSFNTGVGPLASTGFMWQPAKTELIIEYGDLIMPTFGGMNWCACWGDSGDVWTGEDDWLEMAGASRHFQTNEHYAAGSAGTNNEQEQMGDWATQFQIAPGTRFTLTIRRLSATWQSMIYINGNFVGTTPLPNPVPNATTLNSKMGLLLEYALAGAPAAGWAGEKLVCGRIQAWQPANLALNTGIIGGGISPGTVVDSGSGTVTTPPSSIYAIAVLKNGPVGYWRENEAPNSTLAADSSGGNNLGTYTGTLTLGNTGPFSADTTDGAMASAGTGYIVVPNSTALNITAGAVSCEIWVKSAGAQKGFAGLMWKQNVPSAGMGYGINLDSNGQSPVFAVSTAAGVGLNVVTNDLTSWTWDTGWHHIVGVYDGAHAYLYIDGAVQGGATVVGTGSILDSSSSPLWIAGLTNTTGGFTGIWNGLTAEAAVYNFALTAAQVLADYQAGLNQLSQGGGFSTVSTSGAIGSPYTTKNTTGTSTVTTTDSGTPQSGVIKDTTGSSTVTTTDTGAPTTSLITTGQSTVTTTGTGSPILVLSTTGQSTVTTTDTGTATTTASLSLSQWGRITI